MAYTSINVQEYDVNPSNGKITLGDSYVANSNTAPLSGGGNFLPQIRDIEVTPDGNWMGILFTTYASGVSNTESDFIQMRKSNGKWVRVGSQVKVGSGNYGTPNAFFLGQLDNNNFLFVESYSNTTVSVHKLLLNTSGNPSTTSLGNVVTNGSFTLHRNLDFKVVDASQRRYAIAYFNGTNIEFRTFGVNVGLTAIVDNVSATVSPSGFHTSQITFDYLGGTSPYAYLISNHYGHTVVVTATTVSSTPTFGAVNSVTLPNASNHYTSGTARVGLNKAVLQYSTIQGGSISGNGAVLATVDPTTRTTTFGSGFAFMSSIPRDSQVQQNTLIAGPDGVVTYNGSASDLNPSIAALGLFNNSANSYAGIADVSAAMNSSGVVILSGGIRSGYSGLTPRTLYYADSATGQVTTSVTSALVKRALSNSEIQTFLPGVSSDSGGSGGVSLIPNINMLVDANGNGNINNANYTQTWNWTNTSTTGFILNNSNLTSGTLLQVTSTSSAMTAAGSMISVDYLGSGTNGYMLEMSRTASSIPIFNVGVN
jgi:hypothetical protein